MQATGKRIVGGLGHFAMLSIVLNLMGGSNALGQVMVYTNIDMRATGVLQADKKDGAETYTFLAVDRETRKPIETIVLDGSEKNRTFIAAASKEPRGTLYEVVVRVNGSPGSFSGSVQSFTKLDAKLLDMEGKDQPDARKASTEAAPSHEPRKDAAAEPTANVNREEAGPMPAAPEPSHEPAAPARAEAPQERRAEAPEETHVPIPAEDENRQFGQAEADQGAAEAEQPKKLTPAEMGRIAGIIVGAIVGTLFLIKVLFG